MKEVALEMLLLLVELSCFLHYHLSYFTKYPSRGSRGEAAWDLLGVDAHVARAALDRDLDPVGGTVVAR